jgi:hypothetical protein
MGLSDSKVMLFVGRDNPLAPVLEEAMVEGHDSINIPLEDLVVSFVPSENMDAMLTVAFHSSGPPVHKGDAAFFNIPLPDSTSGGQHA